jgi:anti-sigma regulatory factor (Ser/Thr protein kinase)
VVDDTAEHAVAVAPRTQVWAEESLDVLVSRPDVWRVGLAVVEGGGRRLNFTSADRSGAKGATWCQVDAYDDIPLNTAVRTGRAVVGSLAQLEASHPVFAARQHATGSCALAAVPLVAAGRTLGAFVLFYDAPTDFGAAAVRQLQVIAEGLAEELRRALTEDVVTPEDWRDDAAPGALVVRFRVLADPAAVAPARHELRATLLGWDVDLGTVETAMLCMSELVTNAVVHAVSGCVVHVTRAAGVVTVAVRSSGPPHDPPRSAADTSLQVHGRGLQLVDGLASRWGSELDGASLTTWFALEV